MNQFYLSTLRKIISLAVFCLLASPLQAQKWFDMMNDENVNFYEVQKEAEKYFQEVGTGRGTGYKLYKRWEYETQLEIDANGNRRKAITTVNEFNKYKAALAKNKSLTAANDNWTEMGPTYWSRTSGWNPGVGRIVFVAVDPNNNNIIYVASPGGGAWKTSNGGTNWTPLTDRLPSMYMYSVGIDPSNSNTVYFGTQGLGIYKSTNGGTTMAASNSGYPTSSTTRKIMVQPGNSNIVLAATSSGIYRSTNAGASWSQVASGGFNDLEFKPGDPNTVYACGNSFYKSTNNGTSFTLISNGIPGSGRSFIAVTPANANYVYMLQANGNEFGRLYRSTDSGNSFATRVTGSPAAGTNYFGYSPAGTDAGGQAFHDMALCVSPTNTEEVHIAGIICWKSTNGGSSFVATTEWSYPNSRGYNHADVHSLEYVGNTIFSSSDGGIFKSTNGGDDWTDLSRGLGIRQFYKIANAETDANMVGGGSQDNGQSIYKSTGWIDWLGADGMDVMIDNKNANIIYACTQNGGLNKSTNGGQSRGSISSPPGSGNWVTPLAMDPVNPAIIYIGYAELYKSTNSGSSWTAISAFGGGGLDNVTVAPTNGSYIYASKGNTLWVTKNGGGSWTNITAGISGRVTGITVHNSSPEKVAISTSNGTSKVYKSTNAGASWTAYANSLPNISANTIVYQNGSAEGLYVGMSIGVYYINNTMSAWVPFMTNLPNVSVYELEIHHPSNRIRVGTHGRGLWQSPLYVGGNQSPAVSITAPANNATFTAPASINITANASDPDGTISNVQFFNGGASLGTDATAPYSFSWTNVAAGTYTITARATDNLGAITTSSAITVIVNPPVNKLPTVSITAPVNNASFNAPANITISANAADQDGTISKVEFYNGATKIGDDPTSPYSISWNNVAAGTYTITARATDNQNGVTTSTAITVVVKVANAVGTFFEHCNYDPAGYSVQLAIGDYTTAQMVAAGIKDNDISSLQLVSGYQVTLFNGDNFTGTSLLVTASNSCLVANSFNDIVSSMRVAKIPVNQLPTVSITSPSNGASFVAPANITINANASDPDAGGSITSVQFFNGAASLGTDATAPYSFVWSNVAAGTYSITARATDNASGVTTSTAITITVTTPNNQLPSVSITSPASGASFVAPANITINADAADGDGTISSVQFFNGATSLGTDATAPYSFVWSNVAAGTYSITARATDNASGVTTSSAVSITVTAPVNQLPIVSITSPSNGASFVAPANITINANASDPDAGGSITSVQFFNGATSLGTDATAPYSVVWSNVAAGTYSITARATDNSSGVTTSSVVSITVTAPVNQLPIVSITSPSSGASFVAPANITINANASDPDAGGSITSVQFFNGATSLGTDATAPYSFVWSNVAAGTYSITARATDNSSGVTTSSVVSITVTAPVNQLPIVSITSPSSGASFTAPANITINANASDPDAGGSITNVQFFNGATSIGTDATAPYSIAWNNVAAGTYSITARATDNSSGVTTSSVVTITVTTSTDVCAPVSQYVENNGYVAGSRVKNVGRQYECKEWPYSGWCNGAAWAYAPGSGMYWTDAWYDRGSCTARIGTSDLNEAAEKLITLAPNPAQNSITLEFNEMETLVDVVILDAFGHSVQVISGLRSGDLVDVSTLSSGLYTLRIEGVNGIYNRKMVKE